MKAYKSVYYDEFVCLADQCPATCCKGWRIPLDDAALLRYRNEKGALGLALHTAVKTPDISCFSKHSRRCPFLTSQGLCYLQLKKGHDYLPEVCRDFPRSELRCLDRVEYHLVFSCVGAAERFIKEHGKTGMTDAEISGEEAPEPYGNNDDAAYLSEVLADREQWIRILRGAKDAAGLNEALGSILSATAERQDRLLRSANPVSLTEENGDIPDHKSKEKQSSCFPLPITVLNDFLSTCFFEENLRRTSPYLYRLCRLYYKHFDRLSEEQGQALLNRMAKEHLDDELSSLCADYMITLLYRNYMMCFEDYCPHRHVVTDLAAVNLFVLFALLMACYKDKTDIRTRSLILSDMEKRFFHNRTVQKEILACFHEKNIDLSVNKGL